MYPQAASHGNVLTFTPRGFSQTLNVKFPDSRLAVCEKCKKVSVLNNEALQNKNMFRFDGLKVIHQPQEL